MNTQLTDEQLLEYSRQALIPGPGEGEPDFLRRVNFCLELDHTLRQRLEKEFAFPAGDKVSKEALSEAFSLSEKNYGLRAEWIPLYFSNQHLAPWHGGCAWIFQLNESSPVAALMQLRSRFSTHKNYFGIYRREELIAHELAHVGRMMFEEPVFEELLAYRTSLSPFRRWLGPVINSSKETLLFVVVIGTIFALDLFAFVSQQPALYHQLLWVKAIPFLLIFGGLVRLWRRQRLFKSCLDKLEKAVGNPSEAKAVIYRLTDSQIIAFAKLSPEAIRQQVTDDREHSLLSRLIALYFK